MFSWCSAVSTNSVSAQQEPSMRSLSWSFCCAHFLSMRAHYNHVPEEFSLWPNPLKQLKFPGVSEKSKSPIRHYENMSIQIYWKFYKQKRKKFQIKNSDIFHTSAQNIDCGYSLEPPRRGGSNEYPQSMLWAEIRKIMYTPVNPSFTI